jgi:glutamate-1-semialdehyde 2,1-aminomutase
VHSGTFDAHLVPILAARALLLQQIQRPHFYPHLAELESLFYPALREAFARAGLPVWVRALGARFSLQFGLQYEPRTYRDATLWDRQLGRRFFGAAIEEGVYFHCAWHHGICSQHTPADLEQALHGIERAAHRVATGQA